MKISFCKKTKEDLISLSHTKKVFLEGNIIKLINDDDDLDFRRYLQSALENDKSARQKRLAMTKEVQKQNQELKNKQKENELQNKQLKDRQEENETLMHDLKDALYAAENAQKEALNDLSLMQQKTQFELIGRIVQTALIVIIAVGIITTILYGFAIFSNSSETTLIGNTWSNLFGILLTNSFSIIGTIMGVKYASDSRNENKNSSEKS